LDGVPTCRGLIHGYATFADEVVRGVIETNLPVLSREVACLLEEPMAK